MPHFSVSNKSPIREVVFGRLATLVVYARPFTDLSQSTKIHEYIQLLWRGKLENMSKYGNKHFRDCKKTGMPRISSLQKVKKSTENLVIYKSVPLKKYKIPTL